MNDIARLSQGLWFNTARTAGSRPANLGSNPNGPTREFVGSEVLEMPFRENDLDVRNKERKNIGVGIDVTQLCQCMCPTCFYEKTPGMKDMPFCDYQNIVDQAASNGFRELYLLGGEPTLHSGILEMLDYAAALSIFNPIILVTNGLKLSDEAFCRTVAEKGVVVAAQRHAIGDDGEATAVQDTVMGVKGTLPITNKAFENIEKYFNPSKVAVQCCITRPVVDSGQIFKVFAYAKEHGFEHVMECTKSTRNFPRGGAMDLSPKELSDVYKKFQEMDACPEAQEKPLTPQAFRKTCHMPETGLHVLLNSDVVPCVGQTYKLGNLHTDQLADILESDKRKFFQRPETRIIGHCKDCEYLIDCTGGCRGDAYYITGCFSASAVQCPQLYRMAESRQLGMYDFIPKGCSGCQLEGDPACGIKNEVEATLRTYLQHLFKDEAIL